MEYCVEHTWLLLPKTCDRRVDIPARGAPKLRQRLQSRKGEAPLRLLTMVGTSAILFPASLCCLENLLMLIVSVKISRFAMASDSEQ